MRALPTAIACALFGACSAMSAHQASPPPAAVSEALPLYVVKRGWHMDVGIVVPAPLDGAYYESSQRHTAVHTCNFDLRPSGPILVAVLLWVLPAAAQQPASDAYVARVEAALLLQTLNADLLGHDSATLTLQRWCDTHRLAVPARIVAARVPGVYQAPSEEQRQQLRVAPTEEVRYRRVRLLCGTVVLSEADNWYIPARLTTEMNQRLDTTDTPFGVAVQSLHFQRRTLSAEVLWQLLPPQWEMQLSPATAGTAAEPEPCVPPQVLRHRALLMLPDGTPFSEVVETYTSEALAVPRLRSLHRC